MMAAAVGRPPTTYDHSAWLLRHGLVPPGGLERYQTYALPDLITYAYPQAEGEERRLLVDMLGWFTILDDHFDGPAGRDLPGTRDLVRQLLDVLYAPDHSPQPDSPPEAATEAASDGQGPTEPDTERGPHPHPGPVPGSGTGLRLSSRQDRCALSDGVPATADPAAPVRGGHGRLPASDRVGRRHAFGARHPGRSTSPSGPDPAQLLAAWCDLWRRQRAGMSEGWSRRAARDWARCLTTFVAEAGHRTAATLPTVRQAVLLRRHASCLYPFMNMLERVRGTALPETLHAERELRLLRAHVADAATLVNDLYSLKREERLACPFNMIVILQRERRLSRGSAVDVVRTEVERLGVRSDILRNSLAARHPEADWYLCETHRLVEAVKRWSSTTNRYTATSP